VWGGDESRCHETLNQVKNYYSTFHLQ
jgi:hypothetical protein